MTALQEKNQKKLTNKLPDGPTAPSWWQLMQWTNRPLQFLEECDRKYGDAFTLRFSGFPPQVFLSHPQAIQEIFTADSQQFDSGKAVLFMQPLFGENSLILLDGASHQRHRRLLMPPFHGERIQVYGRLICEITRQVTNQWRICSVEIVRDAMREITLKVMLRAIFGIEDGQCYQQFGPLLKSLLAFLGSPLGSNLFFMPSLQQDWGAWSPWGNFLRCLHRIDEFIYAEIQQKQQQPDASSTDILSLMISARDEDGQPMTDRELRDELMTLLLSGYMTTANALTWALYRIHKHLEVRDRLMDELHFLGNYPNPIEIAQLPYLTAVCQETFRMYPFLPTTNSRIVKAPIEIMGQQFDTGIYLEPAIYLTHHREELYPQPKQFRPSRFLERQFSPYEYFPFGGGNRRCIGMAFAQFQMKLVLATILCKWQLRLADNRPVKPVREAHTLGFNRKFGMVVTGKVN